MWMGRVNIFGILVGTWIQCAFECVLSLETYESWAIITCLWKLVQHPLNNMQIYYNGEFSLYFHQSKTIV